MRHPGWRKDKILRTRALNARLRVLLLAAGFQTYGTGSVRSFEVGVCDTRVRVRILSTDLDFEFDPHAGPAADAARAALAQALLTGSDTP